MVGQQAMMQELMRLKRVRRIIKATKTFILVLENILNQEKTTEKIFKNMNNNILNTKNKTAPKWAVDLKDGARRNA